MKQALPIESAFAGTCAEQAGELAASWLATLTPTTGASYTSYVRTYLSWCVEQGVDPVQIRMRGAAKYQRELGVTSAGARRSVRSVKAALSALGAFIEFAAVDGARDEAATNPWPRLPRPRVESRRERRVVSGDEAVRLVIAASRDGVLRGPLGKAVVGLLVGLGMRPSDACRLDTDSLRRDDDGRWLLTVTAKRGVRVVHELPDQLVEGLLVYQRRSRREPDPDRVEDARALLVHPRLYRRLDRRDVLAAVKRAASAAGVSAGRGLTCTDLRRFALARAQSSGGVEAARRLAGHATEATTRRYLADEAVVSTGRAVLATLPDWPAAELTDLVQHAFDQHEMRRPENTCTCAVPWRWARVHLGPLGVDEVAAVEPLEDRWSGVETVLDAPVCVCRAVYVGGFMVRTDGDTRVENLLRDAQLYPEATARARERRERGE